MTETLQKCKQASLCDNVLHVLQTCWILKLFCTISHIFDLFMVLIGPKYGLWTFLVFTLSQFILSLISILQGTTFSLSVLYVPVRVIGILLMLLCIRLY